VFIRQRPATSGRPDDACSSCHARVWIRLNTGEQLFYAHRGRQSCMNWTGSVQSADVQWTATDRGCSPSADLQPATDKKLSCRRQTARCFMMLRTTEYSAKSLKITQIHWKWHHSKASVRFLFHSSSMVTMAVFSIISEIKRDICRKSRFFHTRVNYGVPVWILLQHLIWKRLEWCGYRTVKKVWWYV